MQKIKKPDRRAVSYILGRDVMGWNDKRKSYNRIKLNEKLSHKEQDYLERQLKHMFPDWNFAIGNIITSPESYGSFHCAATAISFWLDPRGFNYSELKKEFYSKACIM